MLTYRFKNIYAKLFAFAGLIGISEWIRSFFLTGFPWNLLGSIFAFDITYLQLASVIGTYGLSMLLILLCSNFAILINNKDKKSLIFCITTIISIITLLSIYGNISISSYVSKESDTNIRIVQPSIPQTLKWSKDSLDNNLNEYIKLSQSEGLEDIDFVIWGETASPYPLDYSTDKMKLVQKAIPKNGYLITGLVRYEYSAKKGYNPYNSMFVIRNDGSIMGHYDKSHLVPFGEYKPFRKYLPSFIQPLTNIIGEFQSGKGPETLKIDNHPSFGNSICYEIIFPNKIIDKTNPPEWLINLTNDGWYGDSSGPRQHLVTTQLRAIEEGITIARAANSGISALISPKGDILGKIKLNKRSILDIRIPSNSQILTKYRQYGNKISLTLAFLIILIAICVQKTKMLK